MFWRLMLFYTHMLLLLQPSVLWLSIVTFNNDAKPLCGKVYFARIWYITNPTATSRVTPPWSVYMAKFDPGWEGYPVWQTGLPALAGHPIYHVNVIKLKWKIIWTGELPHLPGIPHFHVNRPLVVVAFAVRWASLCLEFRGKIRAIYIPSNVHYDSTCPF